MIQIIQSLQDEPIRFVRDPKVNFKPGMLISLTSEGGATLCKGQRPFGIVGVNFKDHELLVPVWYETMVLRTNIFEKKAYYYPGDALFSSKRGMLTTLCEDPTQMPIAYVRSCQRYGKTQYLELDWI